MNGCTTCGGFGMHHDPVAHGQENDEPCMCGTDFTCMADEHECTCDGRQEFVCHDIRNEPHLVGCPRWGTPKKAGR